MALLDGDQRADGMKWLSAFAKQVSSQFARTNNCVHGAGSGMCERPSEAWTLPGADM